MYLDIDDAKSDSDISSSSQDTVKEMQEQNKERMAQFNVDNDY